MLGIGYLLITLFSIIPVALNYFDINLGNSGRDFLIWDNPMVLDQDRYILAKEYVANHTGQ